MDRVATVSIDPTRTQRIGDQWEVTVEYRWWQDRPLTKTLAYATSVLRQRIDCTALSSRDLAVQLYTRSGRPIAIRHQQPPSPTMHTDPPDTFQGALVRSFCATHAV